MIFNKTEKQEREYLRQIISTIQDTIEKADESVQDHVDTLQKHKDYIWSNKDIDPHEIRSMRESILNHFALGEKVIDKRRRLDKIVDIPYFGRIDFTDRKDENQPMPVYIGIHSFYDPIKKKNLIYDWRAPVSGMFYDNELGAASYISPEGEVNGHVSLKRQYRIRKGIMEYMIDTSLTIHDDILQKELSTNADNKMKNIVATIQQEQNRIIRNNEAPVLIIQGVAGSGKTSIALHRVAYLLYAHKESLTSKDILIISPNKVFADYISNVLPELGEESVPETSMEQILSDILDNKYKFQTFFEQVEELLHKPTSEFTDRIRHKATFEFITQLDKFILHVENNYFHPTDVQLTRLVTIPAKYIEEQFKRFHRYPIRQRFEVITDYILEMKSIEHRVKFTTQEKNLLKKEIRAMFAGNNDLQVYKDFYEWTGSPEAFKLKKNRTLEYSDLAPLAYLHIAMEGQQSYPKIKHLLIDEMQDYTPIQYKILLKLFSCKKTVLGDTSQSVNPYSSSTAGMIRKALVTGEEIKLCKSYRSTYEITSFAQKIRTNNELEAIKRHGEKPQVIRSTDPTIELADIMKLIGDFRLSDYKSLGIVCKDESQAENLYNRLQEKDKNIYFLSSKSKVFMQGVVITSAHMAKGLEFDEVIIPHVNAINYKNEIEQNILYIAATRAMHKLSLTYCGRISKFIDTNKTMANKNF